MRAGPGDGLGGGEAEAAAGAAAAAELLDQAVVALDPEAGQVRLGRGQGRAVTMG